MEIAKYVAVNSEVTILLIKSQFPHNRLTKNRGRIFAFAMYFNFRARQLFFLSKVNFVKIVDQNVLLFSVFLFLLSGQMSKYFLSFDLGECSYDQKTISSKYQKRDIFWFLLLLVLKCLVFHLQS